jgi:hypothetical protein
MRPFASPGDRLKVEIYDDAFLPSVIQSTTHVTVVDFLESDDGTVLQLKRVRGQTFGDLVVTVDLYLDLQASGIRILNASGEKVFDSRTRLEKP